MGQAADVTVVDVGDGACSIFDDGKSIMILDCGVRRGKKTDAAQQLLRHLAGREQRLNSLVISHFDDDHWTGLQALAAIMPRSGPQVRIQLQYPYIPAVTPRLWASTLALISLRSGANIKSLSLRDAWRQTGRQVEMLPLSAGDEFDAAGRTWKVAWPPRSLAHADLARVASAVSALEELGNELAEQGHPGLRDSLRDAYGDELLLPGGSDIAESEEEYRDFVEEGVLDDKEAHVDAVGDHDDWSSANLPAEFRERFRKLAKTIGWINNQLSLVMESVDGDIVAFGDCEYPSLGRAIGGLQRGHYFLGLAPHHGTHSTDNGELPSVAVCIAQQGSGHRPNFSNHYRAHSTQFCYSTDSCGTIELSTYSCYSAQCRAGGLFYTWPSQHYCALN